VPVSIEKGCFLPMRYTILTDGYLMQYAC
jgi:hypothetical protein